jgi:hypothetical protein
LLPSPSKRNADPGAALNFQQREGHRLNGGAPQVRPFGGLQDWSHPRGAAISLSGFNAGTNNTITVTADSTDLAPDLDWIEIVNVASTVPQTGLCQPSLWNVTASANSGAAHGATDSNGANRWTTNRPMQAGDYFQIDFTGTVHLTTITLDNSQTATYDYPAAYAVYASQDGSTFSSTPFVSGPGADGKTVITFPQETVRAVRVQVKTPNSNSGLYWSIGELETDCSL